MANPRACHFAGLLVAIAACVAIEVSASETAGGETQAAKDRRTTNRPEVARGLPVPASHLIVPAIAETREWLAQVQRTVRDFQCRVVKRERIHGVLQNYYFIDMWVREEVRTGDQVSSPLAVYLEFLAPSSAAGRRLLFVEGRNEGKILVRKGGPRFSYVITKVDPDSKSTKTETLCPITQSGFAALLTDFIATLERHAAADPAGDNTMVERPQGARLDGRLCQVLRITHPRQQPGLEFHKATIFMDAELGVPVRVEKLDWPPRPGDAPPVIGEYNYTNVKINVGLTDAMFDPRILKAKAE
jgi:hypothetical protein